MIIWGGRQFDYIERLDLSVGIIALGKYREGSYFTQLAISPLKYRKKYKTKYSLSYKREGNMSIFEIVNDSGKLHVIKIEETSENMPHIEFNKNFLD